jgi:hypothetical protein
MTEDNSYLVPVEEMVPSNGEEGHLWAKISVPELRNAMRSVFSNREEAKKKGIKARAHILANYSQEKVADLIIEKLRTLEESLPELIEKRKAKEQHTSSPAPYTPPTAKKDDQDKVKIKIIDDTNK